MERRVAVAAQHNPEGPQVAAFPDNGFKNCRVHVHRGLWPVVVLPPRPRFRGPAPRWRVVPAHEAMGIADIGNGQSYRTPGRKTPAWRRGCPVGTGPRWSGPGAAASWPSPPSVRKLAQELPQYPEGLFGVRPHGKPVDLGAPHDLEAILQPGPGQSYLAQEFPGAAGQEKLHSLVKTQPDNAVMDKPFKGSSTRLRADP